MTTAAGPIQEGEVHVWSALREDVVALGWDALSQAEIRRAEAIAYPRSAQRFRAGRLLLRRSVAALAGLAPTDVPVRGGEGEPPVLDHPCDQIFASVSHGDRAEAVALASGPVGIDVEESCPPDFRALAPVVMHDDELGAFRSLPGAEAEAAFLRLWTRKEAVLKAAGLGFSRDPRSFSVGLAAGAGTVRLDGRDYALADLPGGIGAVALAGHRCAVRMMVLP